MWIGYKSFSMLTSMFTPIIVNKAIQSTTLMILARSEAVSRADDCSVGLS